MCKLIVFIFALSLSSCENEPSNQPKVQDPLNGYTIVVINGCEYLAYSMRFAHKGDCSNPIHKCNCK